MLALRAVERWAGLLEGASLAVERGRGAPSVKSCCAPARRARMRSLVSSDGRAA